MSSGVTLDGRAEILPAGTRLRLLRDRMLIRPLDWTPSSIITVIRHGRPLRGVVEAVGPGRYYRRYRPHATDPNKRQYSERETFIPTQVKPGDVVELGGLNAFDGLGYNFPQVVIGTETFIIAQEQDIAFVHEDTEAQAVCAPANSQEIVGSTPTRIDQSDTPEERGQSVEHHGAVRPESSRRPPDQRITCSDPSEDARTPAGASLSPCISVLS